MKVTPGALWVMFALGAACARAAPQPAPGARTSPAPGTPVSDAAVALPMNLAPELADDMAARIGGQFEEFGVPAHPAGNTVLAGEHRIAVGVRPVQIQQDGDRWIAALDVVVDLDGTRLEALHLPAIGMDRTSDEAFHRSVREWVVSIGRPFVAALLATGGNGSRSTHDAAVDMPVAMPLGPMRAFAGPTGVRGEAPASWSGGTAEFHRALLAAIAPALDHILPPANRAGFHSLKFVVHVRDGAAGEGLCRVDGRPDEALCEVVRGFAWPRGTGEYNVNQFYVLAPAGT